MHGAHVGGNGAHDRMHGAHGGGSGAHAECTVHTAVETTLTAECTVHTAEGTVPAAQNPPLFLSLSSSAIDSGRSVGVLASTSSTLPRSCVESGGGGIDDSDPLVPSAFL